MDHRGVRVGRLRTGTGTGTVAGTRVDLYKLLVLVLLLRYFCTSPADFRIHRQTVTHNMHETGIQTLPCKHKHIVQHSTNSYEPYRVIFSSALLRLLHRPIAGPMSKEYT
eukprot:SAG22_NODE_113_length_19407_cov_214.925161_9_plen_110_part_00